MPHDAGLDELETRTELVRVAVVDDEPGVRTVLQKLLRLRGYVADGYESGVDALPALVADPPAAVLLDENMPNMSGIELCRELVRRLGTSTPPLLMVSGVLEEETMEEAYAAGVTDCLLKPVVSAELYAKLAQALRERKLRRGDPERSDALPPEKLGPYRTERLIGQGAAGMVLRAREVDTGSAVALKVFWPDKLREPNALVRLGREVEALNALQHRGLVRMLRSGREGPWYYIAMELMEGGSLAERVRDGTPLSEAAALRMLEDVASGLAHLHRHGIVHRDVKPSNILFGVGERAVLSDLGLAKHGTDDMTATEGVLGTPLFIAPEVLARRRADARSDLYALGVTALFALHGGLPIERSVTLTDLLRITAEGRLPGIRSLRPKVGPELAELIDALTAHDPDRRITSAEEVARRCAQIAERLGR